MHAVNDQLTYYVLKQTAYRLTEHIARLAFLVLGVPFSAIKSNRVVPRTQ